MKKFVKLFLFSQILASSAFAPPPPKPSDHAPDESDTEMQAIAVETVQTTQALQYDTKQIDPDIFAEYMRAIGEFEQKFAMKYKSKNFLQSDLDWIIAGQIAKLELTLIAAIGLTSNNPGVILERIYQLAQAYLIAPSFEDICRHANYSLNLGQNSAKRSITNKKRIKTQYGMNLMHDMLLFMNKKFNANQQSTIDFLQNTSEEDTYMESVKTLASMTGACALIHDSDPKIQDKLSKLLKNSAIKDQVQLGQDLSRSERAQLRKEVLELPSDLIEFQLLKQTPENFTQLALAEGLLQFHINMTKLYDNILNSPSRMSGCKMFGIVMAGSFIGLTFLLGIICLAVYLVSIYFFGPGSFSDLFNQVKVIYNQVSGPGGIVTPIEQAIDQSSTIEQVGNDIQAVSAALETVSASLSLTLSEVDLQVAQILPIATSGFKSLINSQSEISTALTNISSTTRQILQQLN